MSKIFERIFSGKRYKKGEVYVDSIVKIIVCVVVGALLFTGIYLITQECINKAESKVNELWELDVADTSDNAEGSISEDSSAELSPALILYSPAEGYDKYMIFVTKHGDGYLLWCSDDCVFTDENYYNSVNDCYTKSVVARSGSLNVNFYKAQFLNIGTYTVEGIAEEIQKKQQTISYEYVNSCCVFYGNDFTNNAFNPFNNCYSNSISYYNDTLTVSSTPIYGTTAQSANYISGSSSGEVVLTAPQYPQVSNALVSKVYTVGDTADTLTVLASVSDGGSISYQWQIDGVDIVGEKSNSFTPDTSIASLHTYRCVITNTLNGATRTRIEEAIIEVQDANCVRIISSFGDYRSASYMIKQNGITIWTGESGIDYDETLQIDPDYDVVITTSNPSMDRGFEVYNGATLLSQYSSAYNISTCTIPAGTVFTHILFYDYN